VPWVASGLARSRDPALRKLPHKLAATSFALMVLLTVIDVTVLLVVPRPAPRASVSYDHDQRIDLWGSRALGNLSLNRRRALHGGHYLRVAGRFGAHRPTRPRARRLKPPNEIRPFAQNAPPQAPKARHNALGHPTGKK
jgi:hypothetical protein